MGTSVAELRSWFEECVENSENTHMIIVCDEFGWEDFPVPVSKDEDIHEIVERYEYASMSHVMEVYNLKLPAEPQFIGGTRTWNL